MNKTVFAVALTAGMSLGSASVMALVLNPFTVNENSVPGVNDLTAVHTNAGGFGGVYTEVATFSGGNFATSIRFTGTSIYDVNNIPFSAYLNAAGASGYSMYGLFLASGTYVTDALTSITTFTFNPGGSLNLFIDPNKDTTVDGGTGPTSTPGNGSTPFTVAGLTADDYQIASGATIGGTGLLNPNLSTCGPSAINLTGSGNNCGSFGVNTSFTLTNPNGPLYFTAPSPFYNLSFNSGQLKDFTVASTQVISGSLDVNFATVTVPEPGTIALLGFGLLGMSMARRGRKQGLNQG